jgi:superfamily II DNA or RNA helicase
MKATFNECSIVVTYRESDPTSIIKKFRHGKTKWIISVGMISEGTNIPRLQVCCHLTNIKTEMHFRQILGRILRMTNSQNKEAVMYMPAEPKLLEYAYRVKQDVPFEADVVKFEKMKPQDKDLIKSEKNNPVIFDKVNPLSSITDLTLSDFGSANISSDNFPEVTPVVDEHFLSTSYEKVVNIFGRFKKETIALGLSDLR